MVSVGKVSAKVSAGKVLCRKKYLQSKLSATLRDQRTHLKRSGARRHRADTNGAAAQLPPPCLFLVGFSLLFFRIPRNYVLNRLPNHNVLTVSTN